MGYFWYFLIGGAIYASLYAYFANDIFEWNADPDEGNVSRRKTMEERRRLIKEASPIAWRIDWRWRIFLGILAGWMFFWILFDLRMGLFSGNPIAYELSFIDIILFILGWTGILGRLPSIADSVTQWFRFPSK